MSLAEWWGRKQVSRDFQHEDARARRRDAAVIFYAGRNGSGKSGCMVYDTLPDLDAGRTVLSTVRLLDWRDPHPCRDEWCPCDKDNPARHLAAHPNYVKWTTWDQMLSLRDGICLADEVTGVADSSTSALPPLVVDEFAQLRRVDVILRLTGLNYIRAHKRLREACQGVVQCSGSFKVDAFHEDGRPRLHKRRRLVEWVTYDAEDIPIESPTESAFEAADALDTVRMWVPDSEWIGAYDTFDAVSRIESGDKSGPCPECGGYCPREPCSCEHHAHNRKGRGTARRRVSGEDGAPALPVEHDAHISALRPVSDALGAGLAL